MESMVEDGREQIICLAHYARHWNKAACMNSPTLHIARAFTTLLTQPITTVMQQQKGISVHWAD